MERLTERYVPNNEKKGIAGIKVFESENKIPLVKVLSGEYLYSAIEKLSAYEDLEERLHKIFGEESTFSIADVIDALEMKLSEPDKKHPVNARILTYEEANKWQEYKDLEEQGLIMRLPVSIGTKVYMIASMFDCIYDYDNCKATQKWKCEEDIQCEYERKSYYVKEIEFTSIMKNSIGKSIFLTREEAEKKLEEMKN